MLPGLKDRLLAPDVVAEFVRAFADEIAEDQRQAVRLRNQLDARLADIDRPLEGVLRAIENGAWSETVCNRLTKLGARKAALQQQRERRADRCRQYGAIRMPPISTAPR